MKNLREPKRKFYIFLALTLILVIFSLIAPYITPWDPYETNIALAKRPPSLAYPFGTDSFGRCLLSRIMAGAPTSIFSALMLVLITCVFGTFIGILCGYFGGVLDSLLMRLTDILLAFPDIILAIAVAGILGGGLFNAMLALLITGWTPYARLARSSTMSVKESTYIKAARLSGISPMRLMFFHILPNISGPIIVTATLSISGMMMGIAGLSFLGLGVQVPQAEWGSMVSEGRNFLQSYPWIAFFPSGVLILTMIVFNLFGDSLRDLLEP